MSLEHTEKHTKKLAATQANVTVATELLRLGTLQAVSKPRERHKVNMHNDCDLLTCPAVWLRFFLATSFVTFTLHSYKTIQLFVIHINDGRTAKTSLVFKRYIF